MAPKTFVLWAKGATDNVANTLLTVHAHASANEAAEPDCRAGSRLRWAGGVAPAGPLRFYFLFHFAEHFIMGDLDRDVSILKVWLCDAWQRISDPAITAYERREIRNYMKEAEAALRSGLKRMADRERARRNTERASVANGRPEFRILHLEA
jgi:hypothetical protein